MYKKCSCPHLSIQKWKKNDNTFKQTKPTFRTLCSLLKELKCLQILYSFWLIKIIFWAYDHHLNIILKFSCKRSTLERFPPGRLFKSDGKCWSWWFQRTYIILQRCSYHNFSVGTNLEPFYVNSDLNPKPTFFFFALHALNAWLKCDYKFKSWS